MLTLKHIGAAVIASVFVTAVAMDTADAARRGGGGGGARAGSFGGGGGMRAGGAGVRAAGGAQRAHVSNPIARPGLGNRPGGPDFGRPGRPGRPGGGDNWGGGYWPGYGVGWGAAAVGAGLAASSYCDPYYGCDGSYAPAYGATYGTSDAIAECARRFRSYDPASQTYLAYNGQRIQCPQ